jgi:Protein of unknown function (DUF1488)
MALNFTNESRSYDATRRAVRFWGYDQAMEVSFFVTDAALQKLMPGAAAESAFLKAFDENRDRIRDAAATIYRQGPRGSYEITKKDI